MNLENVFSRTAVLALTFSIVARESLELPGEFQANTIRGAFGTYFRRLVCLPTCRAAVSCPLLESCPYKVVFEPSPPLSLHRLSKNQDLPRPFIFRTIESNLGLSESSVPTARDRTNSANSGGNHPTPPRSMYEPGDKLHFHVLLIGKAVEYLPYFVLSFREVERSGFGLNRARCQLQEVSAAGSLDRCDTRLETIGFEKEKALESQVETVYTFGNQILHTPKRATIAEFVDRREEELYYDKNGATFLTVRFLSPTSLRFEGREIRNPAFHHFFKRVRDRVNALCTFYGAGSIDTDFKALGSIAERVATRHTDLRWVEQTRFSSKIGRRHELSGFVGECIYDLSDLPRRSRDELLRWLLAGELLHVGKHAVWGNGNFACTIENGR